MFAVLGEIQFETLTSPRSLETSRPYDYAEHKVVEDRPRLQWLAQGLQVIQLEMLFHVSFTTPLAQLAALRAAGADHQARALVFGNGLHAGYFVVAQLQETSTKLADDGSIIAATARVTLKEWARGSEIDPSAPPKPAAPPVAIVAAPAGTPTGAIPAPPPLPIFTPGATYTPATLSSPGVSPLLGSPQPSGPGSPGVSYANVSLSTAARMPA